MYCAFEIVYCRVFKLKYFLYIVYYLDTLVLQLFSTVILEMFAVNGNL